VIRLGALCVIGLVLLSAPSAAQPEPPAEGEGAAPQSGAPDPEALLAEAERRYDAMEYEEALKVLVLVLQVPSATPIQKARTFLSMGVCFTALGNAENAVLAFIELLKLKSDFRVPPSASPSIRAMFAEALKRLNLPETPPPQPADGAQEGGAQGARAGGPQVKAKLPPKSVAGQSVDVRVELTDPNDQVEDLVIHWRRVNGPDWSMIRMKFVPGQRQVRGMIPGAMIGQREGRLHIMVEALGQGGTSLATAGTPLSPLEVALTAPPTAKRRWGWYALGIGGGLAIAGGVVAAILLTRGESLPPPKTTADVSVTIR